MLTSRGACDERSLASQVRAAQALILEDLRSGRSSVAGSAGMLISVCVASSHCG